MSKELECYIYPGCEGLTALIQTEYMKLKARKCNFSLDIPQSAFAYYAATLTYCRLLKAYEENGGLLSSDERSMLLEIKCLKPPYALSTYIGSFGNINDVVTKMKMKMKIIRPPLMKEKDFLELPGYFGPIKENAKWYAAYPCLAVYARRIIADILHTTYNAEKTWDLPPEFQYAGHRITESCLGYEEAMLLNPLQIATLRYAGISSKKFSYTYKQNCFSFALLDLVQTWIDSIENIKNLTIKRAGDQSQLVLTEVHNPMRNMVDSQYIANRGSMYPAFLLRLNKNVIDKGERETDIKLLMCPFKANSLDEVPKDLNFLREAENDLTLKIKHYDSILFTLVHNHNKLVTLDF